MSEVIPNERDREVFQEAYRAACESMWRYGKNDNEVEGVGSGHVIATYRAEIEAAARADERAKRDALLIDAMNLLEANVRTKSRDDLAEQKLIVAIRSLLWGD